MKVKEESEKVGLKLNIQETKIIASSPITSGEIDRETVETEMVCTSQKQKILKEVARIQRTIQNRSS